MVAPTTNPIKISVADAINSIDLLNSVVRKLIEPAKKQSQKIGAAIKDNPDFEYRVNRIQLHSDIQSLRSVIKRSNDLIRADKEMKINPGRWKDAGEYLKYAKAKKFASANAKERYILTHSEALGGDTAAEDVYSANSQRLRDDMLSSFYAKNIKGGAGKRKADIAALMDSGMTQSDAERYLQETRDYEARRLRRERLSDQNKRAHNGTMAFKRDIGYLRMNDLDRFIYDNQDRYGGGDDGKKRARIIWEEKLFKEFKWLKPLAKGSTTISRHLPTIARGIKGASKLPFIGAAIKNPIGAAVAAGVGMAYTTIKTFEKIGDKAARASSLGLAPWMYESAGLGLAEWGGTGESMAKPVGNWRIAMGKMYHGGGTEHLSTLARYGISPVGKNGLMNYSEMLDAVGGRIQEFMNTGREDEALALASELGLDPAMFNAMNGYGSRTTYAIFGRNSGKAKGIMTEKNIKRARETKSNLSSLSNAADAALIGVWDHLKGTLTKGYILHYAEKAYDYFTKSEKAASSADVYESGSITNNTQTSTKNTSVSINGPINISTNNPKAFIDYVANMNGVLASNDPILI